MTTNAGEYQVGWGRRTIDIEPVGYAMNGYGMTQHRAVRATSDLFARALVVAGPDGPTVVICCVDLAMVTRAMRAAAVERLSDRLGDDFDPEAFALVCTHTHSSPGGCGHEALYNMVTPGFVPEHLEAVTTAVTEAVVAGWESTEPTTLTLGRSAIDPDVPVAWNRSLPSYNRNPEVQPRGEGDTHRAIDREMAVLGAHRDGRPQALLSLFGVHATCIGNDNDSHDGDNKGAAAAAAEQALADGGAADPVAIFAQATAGDVSPHYHGPGDQARRRAIRESGDVAYARTNGGFQAAHALDALAEADQVRLDGPTDAVFGYHDLTDVAVDPRWIGGVTGARTSDPCHGTAFFAGTPVDGRGAPEAVERLSARLARIVRWRRLRDTSGRDHEYYRALYASQGNKTILLEAERKEILGRPLARLGLPDAADPSIAELKRQARAGALDASPLVPTVLPFQILRIGPLAIVCCPGEFTTVAGRRLLATVAEALRPEGIAEVAILTYANDYMGYVTTAEEYAEQRYEGGHTIFGQWTLGAFQTIAAAHAARLVAGPASRTAPDGDPPPPVPESELAARSALGPRR